MKIACKAGASKGDNIYTKLYNIFYVFKNSVLVFIYKLANQRRQRLPIHRFYSHIQVRKTRKEYCCAPLDWTKIINEELSSDEMATQFYETLWPKFETCFPLIKVRSSSREPPFMSPLVKHLLKKRKQATRTNDEETITRLQNQINRLIHSNQVNAVKNEKNGSKKWWSKVNSMTGRKGNTLPVSYISQV